MSSIIKLSEKRAISLLKWTTAILNKNKYMNNWSSWEYSLWNTFVTTISAISLLGGLAYLFKFKFLTLTHLRARDCVKNQNKLVTFLFRTLANIRSKSHFISSRSTASSTEVDNKNISILECLPEEVQIIICNHLPLEASLQLRLVSQHLKFIVDNFIGLRIGAAGAILDTKSPYLDKLGHFRSIALKSVQIQNCLSFSGVVVDADKSVTLLDLQSDDLSEAFPILFKPSYLKLLNIRGPISQQHLNYFFKFCLNIQELWVQLNCDALIEMRIYNHNSNVLSAFQLGPCDNFGGSIRRLFLHWGHTDQQYHEINTLFLGILTKLNSHHLHCLAVETNVTTKTRSHYKTAILNCLSRHPLVTNVQFILHLLFGANPSEERDDPDQGEIPLITKDVALNHQFEDVIFDGIFSRDKDCKKEHGHHRHNHKSKSVACKKWDDILKSQKNLRGFMCNDAIKTSVVSDLLERNQSTIKSLSIKLTVINRRQNQDQENHKTVFNFDILNNCRQLQDLDIRTFFDNVHEFVLPMPAPALTTTTTTTCIYSQINILKLPPTIQTLVIQNLKVEFDEVEKLLYGNSALPHLRSACFLNAFMSTQGLGSLLSELASKILKLQRINYLQLFMMTRVGEGFFAQQRETSEFLKKFIKISATFLYSAKFEIYENQQVVTIMRK